MTALVAGQNISMNEEESATSIKKEIGMKIISKEVVKLLECTEREKVKAGQLQHLWKSLSKYQRLSCVT